MKKDLGKTNVPNAVDQVMEILLNGEYYDVPDDLLAKAVKQGGLSKKFSFFVGPGCEGVSDEAYITAADLSDDEEAYHYVGYIYPTGTDSTNKMIAIIEPMIPDVIGVDGCGATEWYFRKEIDTPAKIAKYLLERGFVFDESAQTRFEPEIVDQIKAALAAPKAEAAKPAAKKPTAKASAKETTSDQLKSTLCEIYGGAAKDWRRDSKKKNGAGQEVREFKNSETGVVLVVTALADGQFNIKKNGTDDNVNISLPVKSAAAPKNA